MTKLTDMQLVLLTTAAGRPDGSLLPPADSLGTRGDRIRRSVQAPINKELATETRGKDKRRSWREDDGQLYGVAITDAGRNTIGVEPEVDVAATIEPATPVVSAEEPVASAASAATPRPETKIAGVLVLLQRPEGATLPELIAVTKWLPHTTRAALTNVRKKGHLIARGKRAGATCYSLPEAN
jgi:hypothetical protein